MKQEVTVVEGLLKCQQAKLFGGCHQTQERQQEVIMVDV